MYFIEGIFFLVVFVIEFNIFMILFMFCFFKRSFIYFVVLKVFFFEIIEGMIFGRGRDFMSGVVGFFEEVVMIMIIG